MISSLCLITFKVLLFVIWMCVFQIWGQHPNLPLRWTLKGAFQRFEVELHFPELDGPTLASKDEAMSLLMLSRCEKKFCSLKLTYQHWALSTAASDDLFMINYRTERCCYSSSSGEHECLFQMSWQSIQWLSRRCSQNHKCEAHCGRRARRLRKS